MQVVDVDDGDLLLEVDGRGRHVDEEPDPLAQGVEPAQEGVDGAAGVVAPPRGHVGMTVVEHADVVAPGEPVGQVVEGADDVTVGRPQLGPAAPRRWTAMVARIGEHHRARCSGQRKRPPGQQVGDPLQDEADQVPAAVGIAEGVGQQPVFDEPGRRPAIGGDPAVRPRLDPGHRCLRVRLGRAGGEQLHPGERAGIVDAVGRPPGHRFRMAAEAAVGPVEMEQVLALDGEHDGPGVGGLPAEQAGPVRSFEQEVEEAQCGRRLGGDAGDAGDVHVPAAGAVDVFEGQRDGGAGGIEPERERPVHVLGEQRHVTGRAGRRDHLGAGQRGQPPLGIDPEHRDLNPPDRLPRHGLLGCDAPGV